MASNTLEIAIEQVHPAVCSASCSMHFVYLYMNQVVISILFDFAFTGASCRMHL